MPATSHNPRVIATFRRSLLRWYDTHKRPLPWRETSDPYAIWLSEIMLQQTTVQTVTPRWRKFLQRWPTLDRLAAAPVDEVLHEWTGLGYYARARNLHKAAQIMARDFDGKVPDRFEMLLALPGMGPYTAAAVSSIAFGEAVPVVDANVERVIARLCRIPDDIKSTAGKKKLREHATEFLSPSRPGDFNQAMMELGATICLPRNPQCAECPVGEHCTAYRQGDVDAYPRLPGKTPLEPAREAAVIVRWGGRILVLLRPADASFGGMWELPRVRCNPGEESHEAAARAVRELVGLELKPSGPAYRIQHTVMRSRITLLVYTARCRNPRVELATHEEARWITPGDWLGLPKSTTQAQIAHYLAGGGPPPRKSGTRDAPGDAKPDDDLFSQ